MVKKETTSKNTKKKVSTKKNVSEQKQIKVSETKAVKEQKGFFQDIEFNLYILVYLLSVVVLLISGVLFYTSELLKSTTLENQELRDELETLYSYQDVRIMKYSLEQFSSLTGEQIENILQVKQFLEKEDFDEIVLDGFSLYAQKQQQCFYNEIREMDLCKSLVVEYDASKDNTVYLTTIYQ